jgi:hypothetical protein
VNLAGHILNHFLLPEIVHEIVAQVRTDLTEQLAVASLDADAIEAELARVRGAQRNLALAPYCKAPPTLVRSTRRFSRKDWYFRTV